MCRPEFHFSESGKRLYRVDADGQPRWVLRAYDGAATAQAQTLVTLLSSLERADYPAERLVWLTAGDETVTQRTGQTVIVTTFIDGAALTTAPADLRVLGEAVGRLHALPLAHDPAAHRIPLARMRPRRELAYAHGRLARIAALVPLHWRERYQVLQNALDSVDLLEDLPTVLIHNDCHPGNARITAPHEATLIDWDDAGWGPAVLDAGFLLASADGGAPWLPGDPPDPQRVAAVVDGYCAHHMLSSTELDRLADAIRFRSIVYGASHFATMVEASGEEDPVDWWWIRYSAAEEIARWARAGFIRHR